MMPDIGNLQNLSWMFPLSPINIVPTTGFGYGIIMKFKTFYLKIYDTKANDGYEVSGYQYHKSKPEFEFTIPSDRFEEFASQITEDNYLQQQFTITWIMPDMMNDD